MDKEDIINEFISDLEHYVDSLKNLKNKCYDNNLDEQDLIDYDEMLELKSMFENH